MLGIKKYFTGFITDSFQTELWFLVFAALIFIIILGGVRNGVERMSKIMMPILVLLAIVVTIYSVTRPRAVSDIIRTYPKDTVKRR